MRVKTNIKKERGVTLVELMIGVAIILMVVVPLANVLYKNMQSAVRFGDANRALQLAQELLEEIKQKRWDELTPADGNSTPSWTGVLDAGETAPDSNGSNGAKLTWDDIDDYNGLVETPPRDINNVVMENTDKFTRTVQVRFVGMPTTITYNNFTIVPIQLWPWGSDFKEIIVTVSWGAFRGDKPVVVQLSSIRGNIKRY